MTFNIELTREAEADLDKLFRSDKNSNGLLYFKKKKGFSNRKVFERIRMEI